MTETAKGIFAMIAACIVWGLSPLFYKLLDAVPPPELLSHRAVWSIVVFSGLLLVQGRIGEVRAAYRGRRQALHILVAGLMISANWLTFLISIQIGNATEASLGYYIFPLCAVLIGRFWFGEALRPAQWAAVALAALAVMVLTVGLGTPPWISLFIAVTFAFYGAIKKGLALGPVVSVTCEILILSPVWLAILIYANWTGHGVFGRDGWLSVLLVLSGPMTATPLILFSYAARRAAMSTVGVLQYINPTLQFFCAVVVFGEPFTKWEGMAFPLIWIAVAIFSVASLRQDRAVRNADIAASGPSTHVRNVPSDGSAKP